MSSTRGHYDAVADSYAARFSNELEGRPLDRAMFAAFAELVLADGPRPVGDLGCGPGRVTAHLHSLGLSVLGIDLSPAMVSVARQAHPGLRFHQGSLTCLNLDDGELGGILARYSIIHTPPEEVPAVFAEFERALAPGGYLLLGFQSGDRSLRVVQAFDHKVSPAYRWPVEQIAELLSQAGFVEVARMRSGPGPADRFHAGHLLARKPPPG